MFKRQLDAHQLSFAIREALAHLHSLWHEGNWIRVTEDKGIIRFRLPQNNILRGMGVAEIVTI